MAFIERAAPLIHPRTVLQSIRKGPIGGMNKINIVGNKYFFCVRLVVVMAIHVFTKDGCIYICTIFNRLMAWMRDLTKLSKHAG